MILEKDGGYIFARATRIVEFWGANARLVGNEKQARVSLNLVAPYLMRSTKIAGCYLRDAEKVH